MCNTFFFEFKILKEIIEKEGKNISGVDKEECLLSKTIFAIVRGKTAGDLISMDDEELIQHIREVQIKEKS